jgi:LysM repeat protein/uncharacterized protein YoaH (UPF0181 family)
MLDAASESLKDEYKAEEREKMIKDGLTAMMRGATGQQEIENERAQLLQQRSQTKRVQEKMTEMGLSSSDAKRQVDEEIRAEAEKKAEANLRPQAEAQIDPDVLNERTTKRRKQAVKDILDKNSKGPASWINFAIDGGVDAYGEAARNYEVIDGGEKRSASKRAKEVNARSLAAKDTRNKLNKMENTLESVFSDLGFDEIKGSLKAIEQNSRFGDFKDMLKNALTYQREDSDGNVQNVLDTQNYNAALENFNSRIQNIENKFGDTMEQAQQEKKKAQDTLEQLQSQDNVSNNEINRAEKQLDKATTRLKSIESAISREQRIASEQITSVAKDGLRAKNDAERAMGTASYENALEEAQQANEATRTGEAATTPFEDRMGNP